MRRVWYLSLALLFIGCKAGQHDISKEKEKIIAVLNQETKYFCDRNLEKWQQQWSHQPFVSKMYAGSVDFEELTGWKAINQFTRDHIAEHPAKIPIPDTNFEYDFHFFKDTAWVFYSKNVDGKRVRETRFMVKENDQWKIGRMQTLF